MKIKRLDARFTAHEKYKFYIEVNKYDLDRVKRFDKFCEIRDWCWEQWGSSREADMPGQPNKHWAWLVDNYKMRIYLGGDNEYTLFALKWI